MSARPGAGGDARRPNTSAPIIGGLVAERRARALLDRGGPGRALPAGDLLREAMRAFERADAVKPADNDDALLRWNACARLFHHYPELAETDEERTAPVMLE